MFLVQYVAGLAYLGFQLWSSDIVVLDSGEFMAALIVTATANSILLVEGIPMVAERFLKRQREEGRKEGREEGRVEGRTEGRVEGRTEGRTEGRSSQQKKWEDWNRRRMQAESRQEPFNEAPPSLSTEDQ